MKMPKIVLYFTIVLLFITKNILPASIDGTTSVKYLTTNQVFSNNQYARGFVKFNSGATILENATAFFNIWEPFSGGLDLRETGTLSLEGDIYLDTNFTLSGSGVIRGNGKTIFLNGTLTIPDNSVIHINSSSIIDGQGHDLVFGRRGRIFVDTNVTLTLQNMRVVQNFNDFSDPCIRLAASRSQLALSDVEFALSQDFLFTQGQIFIYDDVAVTGTSAFIYSSCQPSFIMSGASLSFDLNSIFDFRPSTTGKPGLLAKDLLIMQDATSQLYLNGCMLKTTLTGMRLTKGQILFDNKVSITSAYQLQLKDMGSWIYKNYGTSVQSVNWSPDGRYLAVGGESPVSGNELQIYSFNGASLNLVTSQNYGTAVLSATWSHDGRYLAVGGWIPTSGNELQIYSFNGTSLTLVTSQDYGTTLRAVNWSPDGRYLAVGGLGATPGNELQIYSFNGTSLTFVTSKDYGSYLLSASWSPDGRYLAIGGDTPTSGNEIQVYSFNGTSLTLVTSKDYGVSVKSVAWSPDGRFLAIGGGYPTFGDDIKIYSFSGTLLTLIASQDYGAYAESVNWSSDGRYLAVSGQVPTSGNEIQIYSFNGTSLTLVTSKYYGNIIWAASWSYDGRYFAVGGESPAVGHDEIEVYTLQYGPETQNQVLSNSIVFGNAAKGLTYDATVNLLAGANVNIDGLVNYDCVN